MERERLASLFEGVREVRAVVDSVLEGRLGRTRAADGVARLDIGCYAIFGGNPGARAAEELIRGVTPPRELLFPDDDAWRSRLRGVHPGLIERPMQAYDARGLDVGFLANLASRTPDGYSVDRIDAATAARLDRHLEPHAMQVFPSPDDFAALGIGFVGRHEDRLACAATSYAICAGRIELAISTHPDFRGRGLATAVAARLMAHCLERGIVPQWNAANPVSKHLAVRLGYRPAGICEILYLPAVTAASE